MRQPNAENSGHKFTAAILGEESLLVQCAEMLREQGHEIAVVASNSLEIHDWASSAELPAIANDKALADELAGYQFDYLFSITNLRIIPETVTSQARALSINFHDGPLPAYAGLYATTWALINGEATHGVSWHTIEAGIDEGDLLKQSLFEIDEDETAYTLNVKCYEHAISSFAELIEELSSGSEQRQVQDFSTRSYFGKFLRPEAAATINWNQSVEETALLVKALEFGGHHNPLCRAKVLVGDDVFIVESIVTSDDDTNSAPGTILEINDTGARIAATGGSIEIAQLVDSDHAVRSASSVLSAAGLEVGHRLPVIASDRSERLAELAGEAGRGEAKWVRQLSALESVDLPYGDRTGLSDRTRVESVDLALPVAVTDHLRNQEHPAEFVIGAFATYLHKLTGNESLHLNLGHALDGADADLQPWFADRVPLLCTAQTVEPVAATINEIIESIESIRKRPAFTCDLGLRHPDLVSQGIGWAGLPLSVAVNVTSEPIDSSGQALVASADLMLDVSEAADRCRFVYDADIYSTDSIGRIEAQFLGVLEQVAASADLLLGDISLLSPADNQQIVVDWNSTEKAVDLTKGLHQLFAQKAGEIGAATALVYRDQRMTYAELDARSNQLANRLQAMGAGPGNNVGVFMERGLDMIVGLLGVLKSGAAYIPLDPTYPLDRINFMIEDSGLVVLLSQSAIADRVDGYTGKVLRVDGDRDEIASCSELPLDTPFNTDDLAYLIYTSGSTGKPKGVMVTHANAVNFLAGMDDHIEYEPGDTWLTVTSLSFDISVLEIFWSLTRGLELVIFADEMKTAEPIDAPVVPSVDRDIDFSLFYFASDESEAGSGDKYELLMEGARFADQHGFEAVWTPERHFYAFGGLYPNPAVTGAAIAAITENVHIRAGSCVIPLHHPVRVAEEWAVVDNISKGRVGIAFAAGWQPVDFVLRPENFADRKAAVERDVDIVQRLWQGETITMDGPNGPAEIRTLPRPIQPKLPSWLTVAGNPDTFAAAGAGGFNVLTHLLGQTIEEVGEKIQIYRKARAEAGHEGEGQVTLMLHTLVGDDVEQVRELVRAPMIEYLRSSVSLIKEAAWSFPTFQQKAETSGKSPMELFDDEDLTEEEMDALLEHAFNRYFEGSALFGTPATCAAMVNSLKRIGVDEIACQVDFGLPTEEVLSRLPALNNLRLATRKSEAVDEDLSIAALIQRHNVSHFQCTPSMGSMLVADDRFREVASNLKVCLMGGEAFPQVLAKEITDIVEHGTVLNVYGPTETTIWSSVYRVENGDHPISIGRPLANQQMYIVDANLQPCPVGVLGELLIGGDGVTNGYLNRQELTDERFIPDHFRPDVPGAKLYRTGDLVRYEADGSIDFLGRMDFQVKVRGYRIELGEIEARLNEDPSVREAVVTVREDTPGDQRLVAYVIPDGEDEIDTNALREHLGQHLPSFMVPAYYVSLQRFPLTPNKKTDRKALPAPDAVVKEPTGPYIAPEEGPQARLATIWQGLLGNSQIGVNDNFFDIGGHSLLAVQMHRQVREEFGVDISIVDVFRFPTISALTNHLDHEGASSAAAETRATDRASARRQALSNRRGRRKRS